jgi:hypothetical protein
MRGTVDIVLLATLYIHHFLLLYFHYLTDEPLEL